MARCAPLKDHPELTRTASSRHSLIWRDGSLVGTIKNAACGRLVRLGRSEPWRGPDAPGTWRTVYGPFENAVAALLEMEREEVRTM